MALSGVSRNTLPFPPAPLQGRSSLDFLSFLSFLLSLGLLWTHIRYPWKRRERRKITFIERLYIVSTRSLEMKHAFSYLLLFKLTSELKKFCWSRKTVAFVIQTLFRHRGNYSAINTKTSILFLFYHCNKIELIVFLYRRTK